MKYSKKVCVGNSMPIVVMVEAPSQLVADRKFREIEERLSRFSAQPERAGSATESGGLMQRRA